MRAVDNIGGRLLVGLGCWALLIMGGCLPLTASEAPAPAGPAYPVRQAGLVANPALVESSGMSYSRREADLLWVVNDSGHPAVLYAVRTDGHDQGQW